MTCDPEAVAHMGESQLDMTGDGSIGAKLASTGPTRGEKLALTAMHMASRHLPAFPWLRLLEVVREHVIQLPVSSQERFLRIEASPVPALPLVSPLQKPFVEFSPDMLGQVVEEGRPGWDQLQQQDFWRIEAKTDRMQAYSTEDMQQREEGQPLPLLVQQRLRDVVGPGTETIRTHSDERADAIAHAQRADAVTVGQHVFFRKGYFLPQERKGFALLAHEATHVLQAMRPDSAWKRATQMGRDEDEQEASDQEHKLLHQPVRIRKGSGLSLPMGSHKGSPLRTNPPGPQSTSGFGVSSSAVQHPMTAATDRGADKEGSPVPPMPHREDLQRMVYRDLLRQIRLDLERGG